MLINYFLTYLFLGWQGCFIRHCSPVWDLEPIEAFQVQYLLRCQPGTFFFFLFFGFLVYSPSGRCPMVDCTCAVARYLQCRFVIHQGGPWGYSQSGNQTG